MNKHCADCAHYLHGIGCLHTGSNARFAKPCHATTPACDHFTDPVDRRNKCCATCGRLLFDDAGRGTCHAPEAVWPILSDVRCKAWASRETGEVNHG
jgi:hypothetical protein